MGRYCFVIRGVWWCVVFIYMCVYDGFGTWNVFLHVGLNVVICPLISHPDTLPINTSQCEYKPLLHQSCLLLLSLTKWLPWHLQHHNAHDNVKLAHSLVSWNDHKQWLTLTSAKLVKLYNLVRVWSLNSFLSHCKVIFTDLYTSQSLSWLWP